MNRFYINVFCQNTSTRTFLLVWTLLCCKVSGFFTCASCFHKEFLGQTFCWSEIHGLTKNQSWTSTIEVLCSRIYVQTVLHTVHEIGPANNTLVTCFAHALPLSGRRCARAKQLTTQPEGTQEPNKANPKPEARKTPRGPAGSKSKALGHQRAML